MTKLTINYNEIIKNYYVYSIRDDADNILFINYDTLVNVVTFRKLMSNPLFIKDANYNIELHGSYELSWQAHNACDVLIRQLCVSTPYLNITQSTSRRGAVLCDQTGVTYKNASEACKMLGASPSRMSMHLARHAGHKSINNMTFRYV